MKLTKENIQFIDTYLENSGVTFLDIRFEIVDHIASDLENIEGDFQVNFKDYMLSNKKELLNSNKKFEKIAFKRVFISFFKKLIHPKWIVGFVVILFILNQFFIKYDPNDVGYYLKDVTVSLLLLIFIFVELMMYKLKIKLVALRKSTFIIILIYYFTLFFVNSSIRNKTIIDPEHYYYYMLLFGFSFYLMFVYVLHFLYIFNDYKNKLSVIKP